MSDIGTIPILLLTPYAVGTAIFLIPENRRPQATLAWMLVLFFAPGVGPMIHFLFGRDLRAGPCSKDV